MHAMVWQYENVGLIYKVRNFVQSNLYSEALYFCRTFTLWPTVHHVTLCIIRYYCWSCEYQHYEIQLLIMWISALWDTTVDHVNMSIISLQCYAVPINRFTYNIVNALKTIELAQEIVQHESWVTHQVICLLPWVENAVSYTHLTLPTILLV